MRGMDWIFVVVTAVLAAIGINYALPKVTNSSFGQQAVGAGSTSRVFAGTTAVTAVVIVGVVYAVSLVMGITGEKASLPGV